MGATDIHSAAQRINNLFNPEPEEANAEPEPTINYEQVPQVEPANTEETELVAEESQAIEAAPDAEEPKYTVKVNGEEIEVTLEELQSGYMMQSDYSKKTAEISEKRKALESKETEMEGKLAEAEELLLFELEDMESEENKELKEYDPEAYWKKVDKINGKVKRFEAKKLSQQQKMLERKQKLIGEEQEKLRNAVPDWAVDSDKMQADGQELTKTLANFGFSQTEIADMSDHRMFLLAREALKLSKIQAQKPESKLVKTPPKSAKPGSKGVAPVAKEVKDQRSKLKKSGHQRDAAAYIKSLIG